MTKDVTRIKKMCWAISAGDCSKGLTKEHVVTAKILDLVGPLKFRNSSDLAVEATEDGIIDKGHYFIKRLCNHHNSSLSPYDDEALRLFSAIKGAVRNKPNKHFTLKKGFENRVILDGHKIERWLAKTFYNAMLFRTMHFKPVLPMLDPNPHSILSPLYLGGKIAPPFGLYSRHTQEQKLTSHGFFTPQFSEGVHWKKSTGMAQACEMPICFHCMMFGIEIVGFFNLMNVADECALGGQLKPTHEMLVREGFDYRYLHFGLGAANSPLSKEKKGSDTAFVSLDFGPEADTPPPQHYP